MGFKRFDRDFNIDGKTALITGAAQGIGKAIATLFAEKRANVILVDMSDKIKDVAAEINETGAETLPIIADLTRLAILKTWLEQHKTFRENRYTS